MRVFIQANPDPTILETVDKTRDVARIVVFAHHLGLSILEHKDGTLLWLRRDERFGTNGAAGDEPGSR